MVEGQPAVTIRVISDILDEDERQRSAQQLGDELRRAGHDVAAVDPSGVDIPEGAKAGIGVELASAFAVGIAGTALQEVIRYAWMWLRQRKHPQKLELNIMDGRFEIAGSMSPVELQTLVDTLQSLQKTMPPTTPPTS